MRVNPRLVIWDNFPNYNQLRFIIQLAWEHLLKPTEKTRPMTKNKLPVTITKHIYNDIGTLIFEEKKYLTSTKPSWEEQRVIDTAIENVFREKRHWISYKAPKWLNVVDSLQKVLCRKIGLNKSGDYSYFASYLENEGVEDRFSLLVDMGVPLSVIKKISKMIPQNKVDKELIHFIKNLSYDNILSLLEYEIEKLKQL